MYVYYNFESCPCNLCCNIKQSVLHIPKVFVALEFSMKCAFTILSSVASPAVLYFSTLSHKVHNFRKRAAEHKMYVLILFAYDKKWALVFMGCKLYFCQI
jgi:hypothetical protein